MIQLPGEAFILEALRRRPARGRVEVRPGKRYVLYGAGQLGRQIHALLGQLGIEVIAFIDQRTFPEGKLEDVPVWHPEASNLRSLTAPSDGIILTLYNHRCDLRDIYALLRARVETPIYSAADLALSVPRGKLRLDYWLDLLDEPAAPEEVAPKLAKAYGCLADDQSRELFLELVTLRAGGDHAVSLKWIHRPDLERQYFAADLPAPIRAKRMIDCGAYDGDTLAAARQLAGPIERAACFEPDARNFRKLVARVDGWTMEGEIDLFPLAVWNETRLLGFDAEREASSSLVGGTAPEKAAGKVFVQTIALDDALGSFRPTLIKMDIEGAELEALRGAAKMIARARPQLAICFYHRLDHYWQLPEFIDSLQCGYRLYLRQHGYNGQETVLYALPE